MKTTRAAARSSSFGLLVTESDPKSPAAEAYRTLRTNIQFAGLDEPVRTLLVTSAAAGEGKSTTVANFGAVLAHAGSKVCVIDSDLRRPALHRFFDIPNTAGLTTALVEGKSIEEMARPTRIPNLSILTSGPTPPNPAELVGSRRMRDLIESSTQAYEYVILDSPPIVSVSDATNLATLVSGVILVVRSGKVPQDVVRRTAEQIERVKGRILGVLLNSVDLRRDAYYSHYYRYYRGYYSGNGMP